MSREPSGLHVLEALAHLRHERTTVVPSKSLLESSDTSAVEERFRAQRLLARSSSRTYDEQLATMLG